MPNARHRGWMNWTTVAARGHRGCEPVHRDVLLSPRVKVVTRHGPRSTSIPTYPPEVISRDRLLNLAPDDPADAPAAPTDENLMIGWAKASLVVSFLGPSRQSQVEDGEFKGKLKWEPGYEKSFESIRERTIPSHILRTVVFSKGHGFTRDFINVLCRDWGDEDTGFVQIIPAHYDAPIAAGPPISEERSRSSTSQGPTGSD